MKYEYENQQITNEIRKMKIYIFIILEKLTTIKMKIKMIHDVA